MKRDAIVTMSIIKNNWQRKEKSVSDVFKPAFVSGRFTEVR